VSTGKGKYNRGGTSAWFTTPPALEAFCFPGGVASLADKLKEAQELLVEQEREIEKLSSELQKVSARCLHSQKIRWRK
jgi:hypothetical protein